MPAYRARWAYRAGSIALAAGAVVELDAETAAHINRDSPGVLEDVPAGRDLEAPPADRMVHAPARRRDRDPARTESAREPDRQGEGPQPVSDRLGTQGDLGDQGAITRETFKAVKP